MSEMNPDFRIPPPTIVEWYFSLEPEHHVRFHTPRPPNRFHRWMQRVLLGIYWGKA